METIHNMYTALYGASSIPSGIFPSPLDSQRSIPLGQPVHTTSLLETPIKQQVLPSGSRVLSHDHAPNTDNNLDKHLQSSTSITAVRGLDLAKLKLENSLLKKLGRKGNVYEPAGGKNTLIGTGQRDIFQLNRKGFNTVTTGDGADTLILGAETTNRVFDFNPAKDRIVFDKSLDPRNIMIGQGTNPGKGGLNQPLDSENNTLIVDKATNHILASLAFTNADKLNQFESRQQFAQLTQTASQILNKGNFTIHRGDGEQEGSSRGRDRFIGEQGNSFFNSGDSRVKLQRARTSSGRQEFPFPNDSPGSSEITPTLRNGMLSLTGSYRNFIGLPLFSQGEKAIDPTATILNGSDPVALINGFLQVPEDVEGNPISGSHLHFSPAEDSRGNFADATVIRYLTNTITDTKSGQLTARFRLTPDEQAAFLAGNLYVNMHTNVGGGFPTGENRINFNQKVVKLN
jgi:hypothetical protein